MKFISMLCCSGLLFVANSAHAYRYCAHLPTDSAAFYSCEALKQQDRLEEARKDQQELAAAEQLLALADGIRTAETALQTGNCDKAQKVLDDVYAKLMYNRSTYSSDSLMLPSENLKDEFVSLQLQVLATCPFRSEQKSKLDAFLEREARNGNKRAQRIFEVSKTGLIRTTVPKFADYRTDMASLVRYTADLSWTSIDTCRTSWKQKDADAAYCIALKETGEKILVMLREASKLGHPVAQNDLAMYLHDNGPQANSSDISRLIRASAKSGIPNAQVTVGWWHITGEHGFKVDYEAAMNWNLKAYTQGHSEGANNIGELYEKGLGVPKDIEQAKSWYAKASAMGNAEATQRMENLRR